MLLKIKIKYHKVLASYHGNILDSILDEPDECGAKLHLKHRKLQVHHRDIVEKLKGDKG